MHYNIMWIYLLITEFEEILNTLHIKWTTHRTVIEFYKVTDTNHIISELLRNIFFRWIWTNLYASTRLSSVLSSDLSSFVWINGRHSATHWFPGEGKELHFPVNLNYWRALMRIELAVPSSPFCTYNVLSWCWCYQLYTYLSLS